MVTRKFGSTNIEVPILGYGTGQIGSATQDDAEIGRFLNQILDEGIGFIDTARGYGLAEERIGKYLHTRRQEFILSTKAGYGVPGMAEWTAECVTASVDRALVTLKTDYIDILHLHSCSADILLREGLIEALVETKRGGKVRAIAYSGENEALDMAISIPDFDSFQFSVNICDQDNLINRVPSLIQKGKAIIAKRALANVPWIYDAAPTGQYVEPYWHRFRAMGFHTQDRDWLDTALRFSCFASGISTAIMASTNIDHIRTNMRSLEKGDLSAMDREAIQDMFKQFGSNWHGDC